MNLHNCHHCTFKLSSTVFMTDSILTHPVSTTYFLNVILLPMCQRTEVSLTLDAIHLSGHFPSLHLQLSQITSIKHLHHNMVPTGYAHSWTQVCHYRIDIQLAAFTCNNLLFLLILFSPLSFLRSHQVPL